MPERRPRPAERPVDLGVSRVTHSQMAQALPRRFLLVSHRPLEYEGPGTVRWRYFLDHLPAFGWTGSSVTARPNPTSDELSNDSRMAQLSEARARVMGVIGRVARPVANRTLGVQPEAFPPSMLWSYTGRRRIAKAIARDRPHVVVVTAPPFAALFAGGSQAAASDLPCVADLRDGWARHPTYDADGSLVPALEARALSRFDAIVGVTTGQTDQLTALHPELSTRVHLMPNGFAPELLQRRHPRRSATERVRIIHPGVLYGDRSVGDLFGGIERAGLVNAVRVELVGNMTPAVASVVRDRPSGLDVVQHGPRNWSETMDLVADADIVAVIYPASMGDRIALPVKMFEALALGKPILAITSGGSTEHMLRELGQEAGCSREGDPDSVGAALRRLITNPPAPVDPPALAPWDREQVTARYAALLDSVVR
jgi:glycosyltransferase involved in cell wall biosynthesis